MSPSALYMPVRGVIFDLDGVLVSTDEFHYQAWAEMAGREGIPFTREDNHRLRGVARMASLEIILERATRPYTMGEKSMLAETKNARYRELLATLTPNDILPGARELLIQLRSRGVKTAVGSSSRNAREIISRLKLGPLLDEVVDGTDISRSKPDPEVFVLAAKRLGLSPAECVVVEDAESGVEAGIRGGFRVLAVGVAAELGTAHASRPSLASVTPEMFLGRWPASSATAH